MVRPKRSNTERLDKSAHQRSELVDKELVDKIIQTNGNHPSGFIH